MKNSCIAGGHQVSVDIAADIIQGGGNAIDAFVASYFASCICEPAMASLSSGLLGVVKLKDHDPFFIDAFCNTPKNNKEKSELWPIDVGFQGAKERYYGGPGSVAVPGVVRALFYLHKNYGHIPMPELVQPAIALAKEGVVLNAFQHQDITLLSQVFQKSAHLREIYFPEGRLVDPGSRVRDTSQVDALESLSREGPDLFYRGEILELSLEALGDDPQLTRKDFEEYRLRICEPLSITYGSKRLYLPTLPSKGGYILVSLLQALGSIGRYIERVKELVHCKGELKALQKYHGMPYPDESDQPTAGGTSHMNIIDSKGNALSMSYSLGEGSGIVVPQTGIHLNNMLGEPSLLPGGLRSWEAKRRLHSMMCPLLALNSRQILAMGTGGAQRIPYMLSQVLIHQNLGLSLEDSVLQSRFVWSEDTMHAEEACSLLDAYMGEVQYWKGFDMYFGGVHACANGPQGASAVGDPRRLGGDRVV